MKQNTSSNLLLPALAKNKTYANKKHKFYFCFLCKFLYSIIH